MLVAVESNRCPLHIISHIDFRQKTSCLLCPCPQLTAYWTPPPACPRRMCCCEASAKMPLCLPAIFRDTKSTCLFLGALLVSYYFIMDIFLFKRFQEVNIVEDSKPGPADEMFSPFTHLSIKALMNDHTSQYIINPSAEYFDTITKFSTVFYFITPNMISVTHLILALVSGKFIASENLNDRRIGVVIFEIRAWLDSFDGVVYRSRSGTHLQFLSVRSTVGFYIDMVCDALGGAFLCFGIFFYLLKRFDPYRQQELPTWSSGQELGLKAVTASNGQVATSRDMYSKKLLFWKAFCYGVCLACAGHFWDVSVTNFTDVFHKQLADPKAAVLQNELCHSTTTLILFYLWRLFEAQALLQYILIPIIIDKVWEFLNYTQYILFVIILSLYAACLTYNHYLRTQLGL